MAFEDRTFDNILAEMLAMAPDGVDTRQGSIYYDAVAACALKLANFYIDAGCVLDLVFISTTSGDYLDRKGQEYGLTRGLATPARYRYVYEGTKPALGTRFFTDGLYFFLEDADGVLQLVAETPGEEANTVLEHTPATPVNAIQGLAISEFGAMVEPGIDKEDDETYRARVQEKLAGQAQNGNKQHYKTWCELNSGVGRARILPLWAGENTVKGVLLDNDGLPATAAVVARVQEYIDPGGTGLGEGVANIGAHFTAVAAKPVEITVTCSVALASGHTMKGAIDSAKKAITAYLKNLALRTPEDELSVVRVASIGSMLYSLEEVLDYSDLAINGGAENITIAVDSVAVLKEVAFDGLV